MAQRDMAQGDMAVTREETLERLRRIRADIDAIRQATDSPAMESAMRTMGYHCFLAREYLGEVDAICPEVEYPE